MVGAFCSIGRIEAHDERTKETYVSNPDVDTTRSHLNDHLLVWCIRNISLYSR